MILQDILIQYIYLINNIQWFDVVITPDYLQYIADPNLQSWVFMLTCSTIWKKTQSLADFKSVFKFYHLPMTFGFTAHALDTFATIEFIMSFIRRIIINGGTANVMAISDILLDSSNIGRHTNILVFDRKTDNSREEKLVIQNFTWRHPTLAPSGHHVPLQCPRCKSLNSFVTFDTERTGNAGYNCKAAGCMYAQICTYIPLPSTYKEDIWMAKDVSNEM